MLHSAYVVLETRQHEGAGYPEELLALSQQETANSLRASNALSSDAGPPDEYGELRETGISSELLELSEDLDARWRGALYALSPENPDAARHFCTSAREIVDGILDSVTADASVMQSMPGCERTEHGSPTRRAKLRFLLARRGSAYDEIEEFVSKDIDDIIELFRVFNAATHGSAGRFDLHELGAVKERAESGIFFLIQLARPH
jgi:hypothetical protein